MAVVIVENLSRSFDGRAALKELSFSVEQGEVFGLVGPDGAGKTTCLRMLAGLLIPENGSITVLGRDAVSDPEAVKDDIGYMSQRFGLYDDLTVAENIRFYADLYEVPKRDFEKRMKRLLDFSGMSPYVDRRFKNLSGGMKQKVGLSCALIHTPKLLLLDEPTNGVDPVSRRDFWKIIFELRRDGVTIIVATTYLDEAERCHRLALLDKGKAKMVADPDTMRGLVKGDMYTISVDDRKRALKVLRETGEVVRPTIHGNEIHFTMEKGADVSEIEKRLESANLSILRLNPTRPTLEDAYISLLHNQNMESGF